MESDRSNSNQNGRLKLERLSGFSDGVIAIAITLLVLGLEVPSVHEVNERKLGEYLADAIHPAMGFVLSFVVIGTFWLQHYAIFHYLRCATRPLVVLNGLFLLFLSFIPFPTGLQAVYREDELAMVLYCFALLLCSTTLLVLWLYAVRDDRLVDPTLSKGVARSMTRRLLVSPGVCLLALAVSFASISAGKLILLTIPALFVSHRIVDAGWDRPSE